LLPTDRKANIDFSFGRLRGVHDLNSGWLNPICALSNFSAPTTSDAVKTQTWCAVAAYMSIAIIKKELRLKASLYTCLQILSVSIFEKTEISCALQPDRSQREIVTPANRLILVDF